MRPRSTIHTLCNRMLQFLSALSHSKQVNSLFLVLPTKSRFCTRASLSDSPLSSSSLEIKTNKTHLDLPSVCFSGIAQSVIFKCSHILEKNKGKDFADASVKDLLLEISNVVPEYTRRFWRVSELKPKDVLEILLGFQFECRKVGFESRKVEPLWELFKLANKRVKGFEHLPQSCEVMARMLIKAGLLREAELLLSTMESQGILLDYNEIFSNLIEGFVGAGELERAIALYDRMRGLGLVPSQSCYFALLDHLVRMKKTQLALQVCLDMVGFGVDSSDKVKATLDNLTRLLCADGKIQEARDLVKKVVGLGFEFSNLVLSEIAYGYCQRREFDDLLSFFFEIKCPPDILAGNRIMYSLCSYFGAKRAELFMEELEDLGFVPDEMTFGIFISWSCREGKLKNSFVYLSEMLSRRLEPSVCSYNALICGLFLKGMWRHARDIFDEMVERGTRPDLSTFRILLAGYCKARQFDKVKMTVCDMVNSGLIQNSSSEDQLFKAFLVLGFDPLAVRLKRDNGVEFSKTEFFDDLGNGLYLDTDLDDYDRKVTRILEDGIMPDYNSLVKEECERGNLKDALMLADEMANWGQELSLSVYSALLKGLCASRYHTKAITSILEKKLQLVNLLDHETLNLLIQTFSYRGLTHKGKIILDGMFQRRLEIKNDTYTAIIRSLCKKQSLGGLQHWWCVAQENRWLPGLEDCKVFLESLCKKEMLKEALELLENFLVSYPQLTLDICHVLFEKFCLANCSRVAHMLLQELNQRGCTMDHMAYNHILRGMCKEKKNYAAFKMLDYMLTNHLPLCADVAVLLIPQLCRADKCEKAIALKEFVMREQSLSSHSADSALIEGLCMMGKAGEAAILFQNMLLNGLLPGVENYNILVQGLSINGSRRLWEFLGVMIRQNLKISISTYRNLVRLMCMQGRVLQVLNLKKLMLEQSKSSDLIIYNILIFHLFSTGNSLFVKDVLHDLQKKILLPDEVTYNFLVYGFSKCKDVSSTVHYLSTMISKELRPSNRSLRAAITSLCNGSEIGKALELSREMELRAWVHDSIIQNAIAKGLMSHGKLQEAETFLDRLEQKCLIPDNINYDNLIKCFCSYGKPNKAVDLLNIMLKKGNLPNSTSYDSVISSFCAVNKPNEAMVFHAEMLIRDLKPSISTQSMLVHKLCQDGQTTEAEKILISMIRVGETPTREMYSSVIKRYHFEDNPRKASELVQAMQRSGYEPDFETHWSLISNLRNSCDKENNDSNRGFLTRLLSESGFSRKADAKTKSR
ncbi:hypothetical protein UlMin_014705 [Ulmus minor]